jgi:BMFP domain-containing protein YqiC
MGFVREDELAALRTRLENLEAKVRAEERTSTSSSAKKSTASSETKAPKAKKKVVPE